MHLKNITSNVWHTEHHFSTGGIPVATRMTVVRLKNGGLWLHSPIPIHAELEQELLQLGHVQFVVAPNKGHRLFLADCAARFPQAQVLMAPGTSSKPAQNSDWLELNEHPPAPWRPELEMHVFQGIPDLNESVWLHLPSKTLVLTDLCQCWRGPMPLRAKLFAWATGVKEQFAVPRTVQFMLRDRRAAQASVQHILQWDFTRVIFAHNSILETDAHAAVTRALTALVRD